jgi:GNAT superfamily N-acetyltransferase
MNNHLQVHIEYLVDYPQHLPELANLLYKEFGSGNPNASPAGQLFKLKRRSNRGKIPCAFIALTDDELLGSASLIHHEMSSHPELTPWLAAVYVRPGYRRQGIGSKLVRRVEAEAKRLGETRLYLFTPNMEHFYATLGWGTIIEERYRGRDITIMSKEMA